MWTTLSTFCIFCFLMLIWICGCEACDDADQQCMDVPQTLPLLHGSEVGEGDFPWHVVIIKRKDTDSSRLNTTRQRAISSERIKEWLIGGGSLINNRWVLTAAHLFRGGNPSKDWHRDYKVILGIHKLTMAEMVPNAKFFEPEEIILHENFKIDSTDEARDFDYDVALIKLGQEYELGKRRKLYPSTGYGWVNYTSLIRPVHLPCMGNSYVKRWLESQTSISKTAQSREEKCKIEENTLMANSKSSAVVIGYGKTEAVRKSTTLRTGDVDIKSLDECSAAVSKLQSSGTPQLKWTDGMLCAVGVSQDLPVDACLYDSGGSLSRQISAHFWIQIGIVSWGYGCATKYYVNETKRNFPGYYTNIFSFVDWIKSHMDQQKDKTTTTAETTTSGTGHMSWTKIIILFVSGAMMLMF